MTKPSKNYDKWNQRPYKSPSLDTMRIKIIYALTFNPEETHYQGVPSMTKLYIQRLRALPDISVKMYPELAKGSLRIHYHGIVTFSSIRGIMCFYMWLKHHQKNMTYELDTIDKKVIWKDYTSKQRNYFLSIYKPDEMDIIYERSNLGLTKTMTNLLHC